MLQKTKWLNLTGWVMNGGLGGWEGRGVGGGYREWDILKVLFIGLAEGGGDEIEIRKLVCFFSLFFLFCFCFFP